MTPGDAAVGVLALEGPSDAPNPGAVTSTPLRYTRLLIRGLWGDQVGRRIAGSMTTFS
ncbi:MAG: hypothetical protein ACRDVP_07475 [Acidimicrobiales bacterium]